MSISLSRTDEEMTAIYNRYVDTVYRIALMTLKNVSEAEDATQTVFIKLMTMPPDKQFDGEEHLKAWLIVTTRNVCKDSLKSWWRSKRVALEDVAEQNCDNEPQTREVWEKLSALDEKYRLPVYLYYYEGYKTVEISKLLGLNHATVRTRLRAAKKKLMLMLSEDENYE